MASTDSSERPRKAAKVSLDFQKLFEKPSRWNHEHMSLLNVKEDHHVHPAGIVGESYLPQPDDPLFRSLAEDFTKPTRHEILVTRKFPDNQLASPLSGLGPAFDCMERNQRPPLALHKLAIHLHLGTDVSHRLDFSRRSIRFNLSSFNIKGTLGQCASYVSSSDTLKHIPLCIFLIRSNCDHKNTPYEIMPYLLLQVISAYENNSTLDKYTAFVVTMEGINIQFIRANCSPSYIQDLINYRMSRTHLRLRFSKPYDLLQSEDRWEFMEVFYGLLERLYFLMELHDC